MMVHATPPAIVAPVSDAAHWAQATTLMDQLRDLRAAIRSLEAKADERWVEVGGLLIKLRSISPDGVWGERLRALDIHPDRATKIMRRYRVEVLRQPDGTPTRSVRVTDAGRVDPNGSTPSIPDTDGGEIGGGEAPELLGGEPPDDEWDRQMQEEDGEGTDGRPGDGASPGLDATEVAASVLPAAALSGGGIGHRALGIGGGAGEVPCATAEPEGRGVARETGSRRGDPTVERGSHARSHEGLPLPRPAAAVQLMLAQEYDRIDRLAEQAVSFAHEIRQGTIDADRGREFMRLLGGFFGETGGAA